MPDIFQAPHPTVILLKEGFISKHLITQQFYSSSVSFQSTSSPSPFSFEEKGSKNGTFQESWYKYIGSVVLIMVYKRRNIEYLLHLDAEDGRFKFAKRLRKESTDAEKALWQELKGRKLMGYKFRREHPIHYYIADFYCHEQRLIIKVDGKIHLKPKIKNHDKNRTEELSRLGSRIIRFSNEEVINKISIVKEKIKSFINNNPINH